MAEHPYAQVLGWIADGKTFELPESFELAEPEGVADNGGCAFPVLDSTTAGLGMREPGMSLRDYFAGQALPGLLVGGLPDKSYCEVAAGRAYVLADAMLAARAKGGSV